MPSTYAPPPGKARLVPAHHTVCHVFVGKGTAFEGGEGVPLKDFPDGTSNTILVIEAGQPVPWTRPEELAYDPNRPLPDLRPLFKQGIRVGFVDGSVRWLPSNFEERKLRATITRNGNEPPDLYW